MKRLIKVNSELAIKSPFSERMAHTDKLQLFATVNILM